MNKNSLIYLILTVISAVGLSSCRDDYFDDYGRPGEGGNVTMLVDFMPIAEASLQTRATVAPPGDGMSDIKDMCIVVFDTDNKFVDIFNLDRSQYHDEVKDRVDSDASNNHLAGEIKTVRRTVNLNLPAGSFYIYAVSNLVTVDKDGNIIKSTYDYLTQDCDIRNLSRQDFRQLRRTWDPENYRNNSEMSGYFTNDERPGNTVKTTIDDESTVTIAAGSRIYCWLRRLASKLTVDFDATGLDPSTTIYLKDIRVLDIAYDCSLIAPNKVDEKTAADSPQGLMSNSRSVHKIQLCEDKDYTDKSELVYKNWPALSLSHPNLASIEPQTDALREISHSNTAKALFFYENMQGEGESKHQDAEGDLDAEGNPLPDGIIDSPNSTDEKDPHYKDAMRAGTYVEVRAFYESTAVGNEGRGNIVYRFMLGSNTDHNYDVERNHHYKLTLCFKGYANDYDWHIEYNNVEDPVIMPNPYYISYEYNETLELPITVQGEIVDNKVTAEIIRNDWYPSEQWEDKESADGFHFDRKLIKYPTGDVEAIKQVRQKLKSKLHPEVAAKYPILDNDYEGVSLGFLSLRKPHGDVVGNHRNPGNNSAYNAAGNAAYHWLIWNGKTDGDPQNKDYIRGNDGTRTLGKRVYEITSKPGETVFNSGINTDNADGKYRVVVRAGNSKVPRRTTLYLPLYTRQRNIIKNTSYSGENPYNTNQRRAQVHYSFTVKDLNGKTVPVDTIIDIIQVSKIGNPTGIWRDWNNAAPFHVVMKVLNGPNDTNFRVIQSKGGWSAEVEVGSDWIMLNGGKRKIFGGAGPIDFTYRPSGILANSKQVRCGIILVKYHNYTCSHRIFVRQGYAPVKVHDSGVYWHTGNMISKGVEAKSPLDEGSMFRFGNWDYPIDAVNNVNDKPVWTNYDQNSFRNHSATQFVIAGRTNDDGTPVTRTWSQISSNPWTNLGWDNYDGKKDGYITVDGVKCRLFKIEDVTRLRDGGEQRLTRHQYGVLYADGSHETANTIQEAYGFKASDPNTASYGMRGCFVYHLTNGRQIFFPIGTTGYGHRKTKGSTLYKAAGDPSPYPNTKNDLPEFLGWASKPEVGEGVLRYACGRITFMKNTESCYQAHFYDLFRRFGAIYWSNDRGSDPMASGDRGSMDLNYFTFDFYTLGEETFNDSNGSDACFIRLVQEQAP